MALKRVTVCWGTLCIDNIILLVQNGGMSHIDMILSTFCQAGVAVRHIINQSNFYSSNIPGEARLRGAKIYIREVVAERW